MRSFPQTSSAQTQPEEVSVSIATIAVTAADAKGRPVRDLKPEEFQVEDNGEAQRIVAASAVQSSAQEAAKRPSGGALEATTLPRHFVLIFDLTFNYASGLRLAKSAASHFIAKSISPGDDVAILTLDVVRGIREICGSTRDRAVLLERVRSIEESRQDEPEPLPTAAGPGSAENVARHRALIQRYIDSTSQNCGFEQVDAPV
ncbi:MAG: hypothetical protein AB1714_30100 [Acidobacteriota bacterium]